MREGNIGRKERERKGSGGVGQPGSSSAAVPPSGLEVHTDFRWLNPAALIHLWDFDYLYDVAGRYSRYEEAKPVPGMRWRIKTRDSQSFFTQKGWLVLW